MLRKEELIQNVKYDPDTGEFIWIARGPKRMLGAMAGYVNARGYRVITINYRRYYAHRIAFFYMTGEWPQNTIDHIDGNVKNNSWNNLREATNSENLCNRGKQRNNSSGLKGVSWSKVMRSWSAEITANGVKHKLGYYDCKAAASFAYQIASDKLHGEFSHV